MEPTDGELVSRVLAGDREAFRFLVERYQAAAVSAAYARTGEAESARDCVQEAFTDAYSQLSNLKDPARFGPWLVRMAANKATSWVRRQAVERRDRESRERQAERESQSVPCPAVEAEAKEERERILAAVDGLEELDREIIILRHLSGKGRRETAGLLEISPEAADKRLQRAMQRLRERL
ncbi:MAG: RNA polymerase sigma factor [Planctomycetota bacterium]|jgi:RNA polymerase sigma-70 factor (ECF subfamily)